MLAKIPSEPAHQKTSFPQTRSLGLRDDTTLEQTSQPYLFDALYAQGHTMCKHPHKQMTRMILMSSLFPFFQNLLKKLKGSADWMDFVEFESTR